MTTETMTIHEGLSTLKTLNKRIEKEIRGSIFVVSNKHSNTKISGKSIEEYSDGIKAQYQSVTDMIKRREALKRAITLSNAVTKITINGTEMTVAEAIEYKNTGIDFKKSLLDDITEQYSDVTSEVNNNNGDRLEAKADDYVQRMFGNKESGTDHTVISKAKQEFITNNTLDLIDPLNLSKVIAELKDEIDAFESKVDSAISVSNALTTIEFQY